MQEGKCEVFLTFFQNPYKNPRLSARIHSSGRKEDEKRMKKYGKKFAALLLCACMLSGCTESTIINPPTEDILANLPQPTDEWLVWEQLWDDMSRFYADPEVYPFMDSIEGEVDTDNRTLRLVMLTNQTITREEAVEYVKEVVEGFAELVHEQNNDYTEPGEGTYGSYLDMYEIYLLVAPKDTRNDASTWIFEDTLPKDGYKEIGAEA